jgi:hypothetical protein
VEKNGVAKLNDSKTRYSPLAQIGADDAMNSEPDDLVSEPGYRLGKPVPRSGAEKRRNTIIAGPMHLALAVLAVLLAASCAAQIPQNSSQRWAKFVPVEGQPEPVPEEWLATSEGKFAHSIKIPNPVPKDSGYRSGMSGAKYFEHLCKTEAGEFVFRSVDKIDGLLQLRPMKRVVDSDLVSRRGVEHPELAISFYMRPPETLFVRSTRYTYFEGTPTEWHKKYKVEGDLLSFSGYNEFTNKGMVVQAIQAPKSQFGFTWRGIRRPHDREHGIGGGEVIVLDLKTNEVLGVRRAYLRSDGMRGVPEGVWWLKGQMCLNFKSEQYRDPSQQLYGFLASVLKPAGKR